MNFLKTPKVFSFCRKFSSELISSTVISTHFGPISGYFYLTQKTKSKGCYSEVRSSVWFLSGAVLVDQNYFKSIAFLRVLRAAWIELLIEKTIFLNDSKSRILLLYWEGTLSEYLITISVSLPDRVSRVKVTFQSRWMATNAKIETGDPALAIVGMIKVASRNSLSLRLFTMPKEILQWKVEI